MPSIHKDIAIDAPAAGSMAADRTVVSARGPGEFAHVKPDPLTKFASSCHDLWPLLVSRRSFIAHSCLSAPYRKCHGCSSRDWGNVRHRCRVRQATRCAWLRPCPRRTLIGWPRIHAMAPSSFTPPAPRSDYAERSANCLPRVPTPRSLPLEAIQITWLDSRARSPGPRLFPAACSFRSDRGEGQIWCRGRRLFFRGVRWLATTSTSRPTCS